MGYKNRTITLDFSDLGDGVFVTIRNPRLMPPEKLMPADIALDENGRPRNVKDAELATYEVIAGLVTGWNVFDASDESEDPPCLELPATSELVAKLPMEIILKISEEMANALPGAPSLVPSL